MDTDVKRPKGETRDSHIVVFLSLYLLLLAFFILLNNISHLAETRSAAAMGSVASTFGRALAEAGVAPADLSRTGLLQARDDFHDGVRRLFERSLPVATFSRDQRGDAMLVRVPTNRLFRGDSEVFHPVSRRLLSGIADSLARRQPGLRYEVEMVLGTGRALPRGDGGEVALELRRAGLFARRLRRLGVAPTAINTGLRATDPGQVEFRFVVRDEAKARISFRTLTASL